MPSKFTVTFSGELPDGMEAAEIVAMLQEAAKVLPFKLLLKSIDTEKPGVINFPVRQKSSVQKYEDYDNEHKAWQ